MCQKYYLLKGIKIMDSIMITGNLIQLFTKQQIFVLLFGFVLIYYHTILPLEALNIYSSGKHCEKRRKCL